MVKVKCVVCGNKHPKDYCSIVNQNNPLWTNEIIRKARLKSKRGIKTYICDMCAC